MAELESEARTPLVSGSRTRRAKSRSVWRWVRRIVIALVVVAMLPLALTLVYAVPGTRPVSTLMLADLATFNGYDRRWMSLDDIGSPIANAVLMSEDGQFCNHRGIDWGALNEVVKDAMAGQASRGASTIPMQTVKNLYLWNGRSYVRKGLELPLAVYFDLVLSKRRIMEIYLNIAEWGPGIYGAEAAAQHHFGKPARSLSARQAALLAVTLPNPIARDPARPGSGMNRLAARVERLARRSGGYVQCLGL
jgi:monofunctional biosynthetic peptidoglycan transglycosylase